MSRYVKVASVPITIPQISQKPEGMHLSDYMVSVIRRHVNAVLPDKPDLIVLSEACDRPYGMDFTEVRAFYDERGDRSLRGIAEIAKENNCYIAVGLARDDENGKRYNSCVMIDRKGEVLGYYDKNYVVPWETPRYGIQPGEDITVFECDFGRVGAIICYDLNFDELRKKYYEAKCDLIVFPTHFHGGMLNNIFAHETKAYFVNCYASRYGAATAYDPLGHEIATSGEYYRYLVVDLNLDYEVCHTDNHYEKFAAAKKKYGAGFQVSHHDKIGTVIISSEMPDVTIQDIIKEFDIMPRDEYLRIAREHRARNLGEK